MSNRVPPSSGGPPTWNDVMRELNTNLSNPGSEAGSPTSTLGQRGPSPGPGAPWDDGDDDGLGPDYEDLCFGDPPPYLAGPGEERGWTEAVKPPYPDAPDIPGGWNSEVGLPPNFPPPPPFQPPAPPPAGPEANGPPISPGGEAKGWRTRLEGLQEGAGAGPGGEGNPLPRPDWGSPPPAKGDGKGSVRRLLIQEMRQRFNVPVEVSENADRNIPVTDDAQQGKAPPAAQLVKWQYVMCLIVTLLMIGAGIAYVLHTQLKCK